MATPAVCITGMRQAGRSIVARMLRGCGLDLGDESELLGPTEDNDPGR